MDRSGSEEPEGGVWSGQGDWEWFWGRSEKSGFSLSLSRLSGRRLRHRGTPQTSRRDAEASGGEALGMDRSGSEEPEGGVWSGRENGKWVLGQERKIRIFTFTFCAECLATGASGGPPKRLGGMQRQAAARHWAWIGAVLRSPRAACGRAGRMGNGFGAGAKNQDFHFPLSGLSGWRLAHRGTP